MTGYRAARASYAQLSNDRDVRRALYAEQKHVCAYCERPLAKIHEADHRTRIEHFHPQSDIVGQTPACVSQSGASDLSLAPTQWSNMLLCCDGNERAGRDYTCDKAKGSADICATFRNPKSVPAGQELLVTIERDGRALAALGMPPGAQQVIDGVLGLNNPHLVRARRERVRTIKAELFEQQRKHHGLSAGQKVAAAQRLRAQAAQPNFAYATVNLTIARQLSLN